ncbi:MAG: S41 family peptidase, partial [Terracidiphilus sp.]
GDRSYGVASMQKLIPLDDGSAIVLTVANYYTPDGKEIPVDGVVPTEVVHPSMEDAAQPPTEALPAPSSSPTDPVVKKALEILQNAGAQRKAA